MSSTSKTAKLQLNQWARTDGVCMDDFNADNAKIDAALAAITIPIVKLLEVTTQQDAAVELDLSGIDLSIYRSLQLEITGTSKGTSSNDALDSLYLRINKATTGYYEDTNYGLQCALATLYMPRNYCPDIHPTITRAKIDIRWSDTGNGRDIMMAQGCHGIALPSGNAAGKANSTIVYENFGSISDLDTIDFLMVSTGGSNNAPAMLQAGAKFAVYGTRA